MKRVLTVAAMTLVMLAALLGYLKFASDDVFEFVPSAVFGKDIQVQAVSIRVGVTRSPQGDIADEVVDTSAADMGVIFKDYSFSESGAERTFTIDFRPVSSDIVQFSLTYLTPDNRNRGYYAMIDMKTAQIIQKEGNTKIAPIGSGWYRVTVTGAPPPDSGTVRVCVYPANRGDAATGGILIAGARVQ
jgi:hypothetical protein